METNLIQIAVVFALTFLFGEICKFIKIPKIIGYLFIGIILGYPLIKDYLISPETLSTIDSLAELGIILLFFFVGLNMDLKQFKFNVKESFLVSLFNSLVPLFLGFLVFKFIFNFNTITSLVIGVTLSATSQVISVNLLDELKLLKSRVGNLIITSGAANDVFELVLVSGILAVINLSTVFQGVYIALANISIFIVALLILRFAIFPHILHFFERNKSDTSLFAGSLLIAIFTAILSNLLGLGTFVGALFSGIVIRQILLTGRQRKPWEEHNISRSIHIIAFGFLVPIFFVSSGLKTDLSSVFLNLGVSLVFLLIAVFGTIGGSILGVLFSKGSLKEGLVVGLGMSPRGDIELVIASIALSAGLFTKDIYSAVVLMAFVTTLITPILFRYFSKKYNYILDIKH